MVNEMSIFEQGNANLPAHLKKYEEHAKDAAGLVTGFNSLPKISLRGKQFRYMKDDKEVAYPLGQSFKGIILATDPATGVAKAWYKEAYDSDSAELPDCFSADGIKPDGMCAAPVARSCAECPKNVFGSGTDAQGNPSKGKACSDFKNLFVVEAHAPTEDVSVLRVPATSLKNLSAYGRTLNKNNVAPFLVVTEMQFTASEFPQLEFRADSFLDEASADAMAQRAESDEIQFSLPSKNIIEVDRSTGEVTNALPAPTDEAPRDLELTEKAGDVSLQSFFDNKWTADALIKEGYAIYAEPKLAVPEAPISTPIPPAPEEKKEPQKVMTAKANGVGYDSFIAQNWTDKQLIENGYMELK